MAAEGELAFPVERFGTVDATGLSTIVTEISCGTSKEKQVLMIRVTHREIAEQCDNCSATKRQHQNQSLNKSIKRPYCNTNSATIVALFVITTSVFEDNGLAIAMSPFTTLHLLKRYPAAGVAVTGKDFLV